MMARRRRRLTYAEASWLVALQLFVVACPAAVLANRGDQLQSAIGLVLCVASLALVIPLLFYKGVPEDWVVRSTERATADDAE